MRAAVWAIVLAGCGRMNFDLQIATSIVDVQPRWLAPTGGEILVTIDEPVDASILIDGAPCDSPSRVDLAISCIAPPHAPGNVAIAIEDDAWDRSLTYMTAGPYQHGGIADDNTSGIAIDAAGNFYVSGGTLGALDGPNAGDWDAMVVKYDASGTLQWSRQLGTAVYDYARDVAVAEDGAITIAGYTAGGLDGANAGSNDIFIARYSPLGELQWITQTGSAGDDQVWDLAVDAQGYTVVAARTTGALGAANNSGGNDYAIMRYTPAGDVAWIDQGGTASEDIFHSIAVTPSGIAFPVGYTSGTLEQPNAGMLDVIVARYEPDGTRSWLRQRGSPADDEAHDAHVAIDGSLWLVGRTTGPLDGSAYAGGSDVFAMKYAPDGTWLLTRQFGSAGNEDTYGVGTSASGQVFLSCNTVMPFDGQPYFGGANDLCVVSLDAQGNRLWTRTIGTAAGEQASSLAVDRAHTGLVYVSAITDGSLDGMPSRGGNDIAVAKLDESGMLR